MKRMDGPKNGRGRGSYLFLRGVAILFFLLLAAGCGGGGGSGDSEAAADAAALDSGSVIIGLTDADGDFLTYSVDVLSLTLTRADGAVVETLPNSTRIDFAQYTEMTEFVTAATVPLGAYRGATMVLDYGNADIQVERDGEAVPVTVQDPDGAGITTLEVTVRFSDHRPLVVAPGVPAHMTLDFDLAASHEVDMTLDPPLVTVEPLLVADVNPEQPKVHRVRGPLVSVDLEGDAFRVMIRPWHLRRGDFGTLQVLVDEGTAYEIDGLTYAGKQGLEALNAEPSGTAVVAIGRLNMAIRSFEASEVYAGSSVPGGELDVVSGNITARNGDTLILRGVTLMRSDGTLIFHDDVTLYVGDETRVVRQARGDDGRTAEDLSVGQRVTAFGTLINSDPQAPELDATQGLVRMLLTTVTGEVVSAEPGSLVLDLQRIDRRPVEIFDFTGTGVDAEGDADPANYEIDAGTLRLDFLSPLDPVQVRGFVRPMGQAPADFEAKSVADLSSVRAVLALSWEGEGTATPFADLSSQDLILNLDQAGRLHHVRRAGVVTDLLELAGAPGMEPARERGLFAVRDRGVVQLFTDFAGFSQELEQRLAQGDKVKAVTATGSFDDQRALLGTARVCVRIP